MYPTIESGAHLHTEEPPEGPSMHVKDLRAYEAPFLPLKDPEVLRRTSGFSEGPLGPLFLRVQVGLHLEYCIV